jgi:hypothetical protein
MGKYAQLETDIFSIFGSAEWIAESINTYPSNFVAVNAGTEFLKVSIIPSGKGVNLRSVSGLLIVDIYIASGSGIKRISELADKLDNYLEGIVSNKVQFGSSSLDILGQDKDNPALYRASYTLSFNYWSLI